MIINDAALFAEMTRTLIDPTRTLYVDFWDHKPPALFFFTAPFILVLGTTTIAVQLAAFIEAIVFVVGIALIVYHFTQSRSATVMVALVAFYYGMIIVYTRSIETTLLMSALGTIAVYLSLIARGRSKFLLLSGIVFVFAIMAKQPILTNGLILPIAAFITTPRKQYLKALFTLTLGGLIGISLFVFWGLIGGNLQAFWEFAFWANIRYSIGADNSWAGSTGNFFDSIGWVYLSRETIPIILPLLIMAAIASVILWRKGENKLLLFLLWLWVLTAIPGAMIGRTFKISYFYQLVPPLIIILAWAIPLIRAWKQMTQALLMVLLTSILIVTPMAYLQAMQVFQIQANDSDEWYQVIDYIKDNTQETDCIWTWGHINNVSFYTNRASCSAAPYEGPLMIEDGFDINRNRPQYLEDLFTNQPAFQINASPWSYFPMLERFNRRYSRERVENLSYSVYRMDMTSWYEHNVRFEDLFTLIGYDVFQETVACRGDSLSYAMTWRVHNPPNQYYQMFVQLRDVETHTAFVSLDMSPLDDYPTQEWNQSGQIVLGDTFSIVLPEDIASGQYYIATGFYDTETFERIDIWDDTGQAIGTEFTLAQITVLETCSDS